MLASVGMLAYTVPAGAITLPDAASHVAVIALGTAHDAASGRLVEGYAIVHYRDDHDGEAFIAAYAKGGDKGGGGGKPGGGSKANSCYDFFANGAIWKTAEPWVVNTLNASGLSASSVFTVLTDGIALWEDAADGAVGNGTSINILGDGSQTVVQLAADMAAPDGQNEVYFGDTGSASAIGVTIIWGVFGGPPANRELIEWDQVYNDSNYAWSDSGAAGAMDFSNIATHELGHSLGLADLYSPECATETMYGYADIGETGKQTLEAGDITGISKLY